MSLRNAIVLSALSLAVATAGCRKPTPAGGPGDAGTTVAATTDAEVPKVVEGATRPTIQAFSSAAELDTFLKDLLEAQKRDRGRVQRSAKEESQPSPPPAAAPAEAAADSKAAESVTNVQHAGVDEGGIVKLHGDYLVVLRRGRLFTVKVGDGSLTPVSAVDAFGPDVDPRGAWYDEMLLSGNTIVVIGYSYQRGGTEIARFELSGDGRLSYRSTHHLRSNDYYSSRNYASRLIGQKLVFYTPLYMALSDADLYRSFPAMRRWRKDATAADFKRIVEPTRVYRPLVASQALALHTVTSCDLAAPELECSSTAVMGPHGRVFYVSPSSVYVWMTDWVRQAEKSVPRSIVYRMPLDGGAPTALRAVGGPVDQFSFLEGTDGHLNVVVRADAAGDGMWRAEVTQGDVALFRVPTSAFTSEAREADRSRYAGLPRPSGYMFQNRFVGDFLLYGSGSGWGRPSPGTGTLYAYRFAGGSEPTTLDLGHGIDRIEALGRDALVVGTDGRDLHFSPVALADRPVAAPRYTRPGASQGELRSHGFFYKPDSPSGGTIGLPVRSAGKPGAAHLREGSASILFLRNDALKLSELGDLDSRSEGTVADNCRASCVDWYGNARPLFFQGRMFALLGYEIVEGEVAAGRIREKRRVSFAPSGGALQIAQ